MITGVADVEGFYHNAGLNTFPARSFGRSTGNVGQCNYQDTYGLAYCEASPDFIICASGVRDGGRQGICKSTNRGASWTHCNGWDSYDVVGQRVEVQRVAVSANNISNFLVTTSGGKPYYTLNGGSSFSVCAGIAENGPVGPWDPSHPLAADTVNGLKYYYYDQSGKLYRSTDGGINFAQANSALLLPSVRANVKARPGVDGEVWVSLDNNGLWKSTNNGTTFTEVKRSQSTTRIGARMISFGKQSAGTIPVLYLYGEIDMNADGDRVDPGEKGVFLSKDLGANWQLINDATTVMGNNPNVLEASRQTVGRVFVGTGGRGFFQGNGTP